MAMLNLQGDITLTHDYGNWRMASNKPTVEDVLSIKHFLHSNHCDENILRTRMSNNINSGIGTNFECCVHLSMCLLYVNVCNVYMQ